MGDNKIKSDKSSSCANQGRKGISKWLPRTENFFLLVGFLCTIGVKYLSIQSWGQEGLFLILMWLILPDIVFFMSIFLLIRLLLIIKSSLWMARGVLMISGLVLFWSILNMAWIKRDGVQLQPGILKLFLGDFWEILPLVLINVGKNYFLITVMLVFLLVFLAFYVYILCRPQKVNMDRKYERRLLLRILLVIALLFVFSGIVQQPKLDFKGEALGFSSHWHALATIIGGVRNNHGTNVQTRNVPCQNERLITGPKSKPEDLPNVIIIFLESIPHSITSLGNRQMDITPVLADLARQGTEFRLTRVPVSHTNKAIWAALTGTIPVIETDHVEAVAVDKPYESLCTILENVGYRSAHFEVTKGTCECAPGFYNNLGFDWAWFRENLEDPSAYLGPFTGDDCLMIEPALEWAKKETEPFLLTMLTSVAHGPGRYLLPEGFGKPRETQYEKYLDTVRYTDYFLDRFCKALEQQNLNKNTILCVLGDHGCSYRSQADSGRWVPYEEVLRIPWIIRWQGHVDAGKIINWPCSQLDVTPTILSLIGFDISQAGFEGHNAFLPTDDNRRLYFSSWFYNSPMGFIEGNRKVTYWPYLDKVFECDLSKDTMEDNPVLLSAKEKEIAKQDILDWQSYSQIDVDPKRYTEKLLYSHWRTFSAGRTAWAYYVP